MRRLAALIVGTCLFVPTFCHAATRWVSPTGDGGVYTFSTPGGLDSANIVSVAGDVVILKRGTYTTSINPTNNGTIANRITYIANMAAPESTVVPVSTLVRANISLKGLRIPGALRFGYKSESLYDSTNCAYKDSVINCEIETDLFMDNAQHCKLYNVTITSGNGRFHMNRGQYASETGASSRPIPMHNRISNCTFNLGYRVENGSAIIVWMQAQRDTVDSTSFNIITTPILNPYELDPMIMKYSNYNVFFDNKWTVHNSANNRRLWRMRDSTNHVTSTRDTFLFSGYPITLAPHVYGTGAGHPAFGTRFDYMFYKNNCVGGEAAIEYQDRMRADTLYNCAVFCQTGPALHTVGGADSASSQLNSVIDHCTFVGASPKGANSLGGVVFIESVNNPWQYPASIQFTNNIVLKTDVGANAHAMGWGFLSPIDVIATSNNLYWGPDLLVSRAISYQTGYPGDVYESPPGAGSAFNTYKPGQELNSIWGNPLLAGSTYSYFDPTLSESSPARNRGTNGTDIGVNYAVAPTGDVSRPYVLDPYINEVKNNEITLSWVATGDDSLSGTVASYDARYSTSPITNESEWASATQLSGEPTPRAAGTAGEHLRVTGLTNETFYYFVVRAVDEAGNYSALHTSVCAYPPYYCE